MVHNLLIVESPSKIKTIEKFLASLATQLNLGTFTVCASYGHIRDLEKKALGIDAAHNYAPQYTTIAEKLKTIKALKAQSKDADIVWLATDLDREGEAISWHLQQVLGLQSKQYKRITFNEITKHAIEEALKHPRKIDMNLVNAQQSRRVVDRVVGFKLTQLLWSVFSSSQVLSAGRVQSAVMNILCTREQEAMDFVSEPYWHVHGDFKIKPPSTKTFTMKDMTLRDEDNSSTRLCSPADVQLFMKSIAPPFTMSGSSVKQLKVKPDRPYITSTLQQEAHNKLGMGINRTMKLAQDLYEAGHITYMRTDSYHLSEAFVKSAHDYIRDNHGIAYVGSLGDQKKQRVAKNAQEAHEAIRPTYIDKLADDLTSTSADHKRLYELIWRRTCASCMASAIYDEMAVNIIGICLGKRYFAGSLRTLIFDGFLKIMPPKTRSTDGGGGDDECEEGTLCDIDLRALNLSLNTATNIICNKITTQNTWTTPPQRYTESSIVKKMEKDGIGRPSTYGSILKKLFDKQYISTGSHHGEEKTYTHYVWTPKKGIATETEVKQHFIEKNKLMPTVLGMEINAFLRKMFAVVTDIQFTSSMESQLDTIADGKLTYMDFMRTFYDPFIDQVSAVKVPKKQIDTSTMNSHTITHDGTTYTIRQAKFGPVIEFQAEATKKSYINLKPYMQFMNCAMQDITSDDVGLLRSLPKPIKGTPLQLQYGRYGFYLSNNSGGGNKALYPNQKDWVLTPDQYAPQISTYFDKPRK